MDEFFTSLALHVGMDGEILKGLALATALFLGTWVGRRAWSRFGMRTSDVPLSEECRKYLAEMATTDGWEVDREYLRKRDLKGHQWLLVDNRPWNFYAAPPEAKNYTQVTDLFSRQERRALKAATHRLRKEVTYKEKVLERVRRKEVLRKVLEGQA